MKHIANLFLTSILNIHLWLDPKLYGTPTKIPLIENYLISIGGTQSGTFPNSNFSVINACTTLCGIIFAYSGGNRLSYGVNPGVALTLVRICEKLGLVVGCVRGFVGAIIVVVGGVEAGAGAEEKVGVKGLVIEESLLPLVKGLGPLVNALNGWGGGAPPLRGLVGLDKGVNADDCAGCGLSGLFTPVLVEPNGEGWPNADDAPKADCDRVVSAPNTDCG